MNQIPNIEEKAKCRRCGMSLKDCPKTRWTNPLCIVNGVEWDEHVVGISTLHHQLQKARVQEKMRIKTLLEDLPAFTPCSDKTMGKVADEAKKPAYLTNYLERETVLKLLDHSELDHLPDRPLNKRENSLKDT